MESCIFCKIINKEIPATVIYEDERVMAFNDINPQAPVHVVIIPKKHIKNITGINKENVDYIKDIHFAANKVAQQLGIAESGFRLINNCGLDAGQTVFHLHYHLLGGKSLGMKLI
jgi:histidine triad (HIT) family protein